MSPAVELTCSSCGETVTVRVDVVTTGPSTIELRPAVEHEHELDAERQAAINERAAALSERMRREHY